MVSSHTSLREDFAFGEENIHPRLKSGYSVLYDRSILDLGTDAGEVVGAICDTNNHGIGIDIAYLRLLGNSQLKKGSFICSRAQELPFKDNSVYGVCATEIQSSGMGIVPGMRRLQWVISLGKNYPQISPEVLFVATKP